MQLKLLYAKCWSYILSRPQCVKYAFPQPEVAEIVLDQCIQNPDGRPILDPDLTLVFDFEFVDDAYTSSHWEKDHDDGYDPGKF